MVNDYQTQGNMEGDCDDMCIMACSMFVNLGVLCRMTAIKSSPGEFDHVFAEANVNGSWVPVDPTVQYGTVYTVYGMTFQAV